MQNIRTYMIPLEFQNDPSTFWLGY